MKNNDRTAAIRWKEKDDDRLERIHLKKDILLKKDMDNYKEESEATEIDKKKLEELACTIYHQTQKTMSSG